MGLNYVLIGAVLLYFFIVKLTATTKISIVAASSIVALGNLVLYALVQAIVLTGYGAPLSQLLSFELLLSTTIQFIFALLVFYKLDQNEENYIAWLGWGAAGCALIFFAAPYISSVLAQAI